MKNVAFERQDVEFIKSKKLMFYAIITIRYINKTLADTKNGLNTFEQKSKNSYLQTHIRLMLKIKLSILKFAYSQNLNVFFTINTNAIDSETVSTLTVKSLKEYT